MFFLEQQNVVSFSLKTAKLLAKVSFEWPIKAKELIKKHEVIILND